VLPLPLVLALFVALPHGLLQLVLVVDHGDHAITSVEARERKRLRSMMPTAALVSTP
jgi:hypothetical protein